MRRLILMAMQAVVCLSPLHAQPAPESRAPDFAREYDRMRSLMSAGRWKQARERILGLLTDHEGASYVRTRRHEIVADLQRCAFRERTVAPDPKTLVSGELLAWDPSGGRLRIRYRKDQWDDFERAPDILAHPVTFAGPYSLEIRGSSYPGVARAEKRPPAIIVCADDDAAFIVVPGIAQQSEGALDRWLPPAIVHRQGKVEKKVAVKEMSPCRAGDPFVLKVTVSDTTITAFYGGRTIISARKTRGAWGRFAVSGMPCDEILIDGRVEPAWLQGKIDEKLQEDLAAFESRFDPAKELPAWLFDEAPRASRTAGAGVPELPGNPTLRHIVRLRPALEHLQKGADAEGLAAVTALTDADAPPATRLYLASRFNLALDRLEVAWNDCERALALDSGSSLLLLLAATLQDRLGRVEPALDAYRAVLSKIPGSTEAVEAAVLLLIGRGGIVEARQILERGAAAGLPAAVSDRLAGVLVKADRGPDWGRTHEYKSRHYWIRSDIDSRVCEEAAMVLEDAYTSYSVHLKRPADGEGQRPFRVYLFSGESGYRSYAKNILGRAPAHTAGLYTPVLRQLLIWNLPTRDAMMRTVRHEGFHQYLHLLIAEPPTWFNEGLAEYFEGTEHRDGTWRVGVLLTDHLEAIKNLEPPRLREFLRQDARSFYAAAETNYAFAWAFVHFMLETTPERRKHLLRFFDRLVTHQDPVVILDRVFDEPTCAELDAGFRIWLASVAP